MCCLKYEEETYEELNRGMPGVGDTIQAPEGQGDVLSVSVLRRSLRAAIRKNQHEPPTINTYSADQVKIIKKAEVVPHTGGYGRNKNGNRHEH